MQQIEKYIDTYRYPITAVIVFVLFNNKILELFNKYIVQTTLNSIESSNIIVDTLFIITCLSIISYTIYKSTRKQKYRILNTGWYYCVTLIYLYYRFIDNSNWNLVPLSISGLQGIKISDILLLPIIVYAINSISFFIWGKLDDYESDAGYQGFYEDSEVLISRNDDSNRFPFIIDLKGHIEATKKLERAFAIGIIGKWGTGKTSFMKTLSNQLDNDNNITIWFNPWMVREPQKIIESFFKEFNDTLSNYDSTLKNQVSDYLTALFRDIDNSYTKSIANILKSPELSIDKQYQKVNQSIRQLDKRIIIFIDDVDRLDKTEVIEVLRLIRNTANFSNTYFIVAFDKSYIIKSLKGIIEYRSESFLEKIFQLEYYLPPLSNEFIKGKLHAELEAILDDDGKRKLVEYIDYKKRHSFYEEDNSLIGQIDTVRDIKRYVNIFMLIYRKLQGEVYFPDLYTICLLRLKYPEVYYYLYNHRGHVLTSKEIAGNSYSETNFLRLKTIIEQDAVDIKNTYLYRVIHSQPGNFGLSETEIDGVLLFVNSIFPIKNRREFLTGKKSLANHYLNINIPSCFDRYFDLSMQGSLSEIEFSKVRQDTLDVFKQKITEWNADSNKSQDLFNRLLIIKEFDNREDYEKVIQAIVHYSNLQMPGSLSPNAYYGKYIEFIYQLGGTEEESTQQRAIQFYNGEVEKYKEFILKLFYDEQRPGFMFEVLQQILKRFSGFVIPIRDLKKIITDKFDKEISQARPDENHIWNYFHEIVKFPYMDGDYERGTPYEIQEETKPYAEKLITYFLNNDLDSFLKSMIYPCRTGNGMGYKLSDWIERLFESKEKFIELIKDTKYTSNYKDEFVEFWEALVRNSQPECMSYDFKIIPVHKY